MSASAPREAILSVRMTSVVGMAEKRVKAAGKKGSGYKRGAGRMSNRCFPGFAWRLGGRLVSRLTWEALGGTEIHDRKNSRAAQTGAFHALCRPYERRSRVQGGNGRSRASEPQRLSGKYLVGKWRRG